MNPISILTLPCILMGAVCALMILNTLLVIYCVIKVHAIELFTLPKHGHVEPREPGPKPAFRVIGRNKDAPAIRPDPPPKPPNVSPPYRIIDRLKQLAELWRKRAEAVEMKNEAISPVQSKLVSENFRERAAELDMIIEEAERGI